MYLSDWTFTPRKSHLSHFPPFGYDSLYMEAKNSRAGGLPAPSPAQSNAGRRADCRKSGACDAERSEAQAAGWQKRREHSSREHYVLTDGPSFGTPRQPAALMQGGLAAVQEGRRWGAVSRQRRPFPHDRYILDPLRSANRWGAPAGGREHTSLKSRRPQETALRCLLQ